MGGWVGKLIYLGVDGLEGGGEGGDANAAAEEEEVGVGGWVNGEGAVGTVEGEEEGFGRAAVLGGWIGLGGGGGGERRWVKKEVGGWVGRWVGGKTRTYRCGEEEEEDFSASRRSWWDQVPLPWGGWVG